MVDRRQCSCDSGRRVRRRFVRIQGLDGLKNVTVGTLSFPVVGEESAAYRVTVSVSGKGLNVDLYIDFLYARVGRALGELSFQDSLTPFDDTLAQKLAAKFAAKLPTS